MQHARLVSLVIMVTLQSAMRIAHDQPGLSWIAVAIPAQPSRGVGYAEQERSQRGRQQIDLTT